MLSDVFHDISRFPKVKAVKKKGMGSIFAYIGKTSVTLGIY